MRETPGPEQPRDSPSLHVSKVPESVKRFRLRDGHGTSVDLEELIEAGNQNGGEWQPEILSDILLIELWREGRKPRSFVLRGKRLTQQAKRKGTIEQELTRKGGGSK